MSEQLNPLLFKKLQSLYGEVRVSNEGMAMIGGYSRDWRSSDKYKEKLVIQSSGEQYKVCCDVCNDTRFRLFFSHCWGKKDLKGNKNHWLVMCQNENCYADYLNRERLIDRMYEIAGVLDTAPIKKGKMVLEAEEVDPPGPVIPLHKLPPDHPANVYLANRFYDPEQCSRKYGIGYCINSHFWLARDRIYIPLFQHGKLKGWQMRYPGEMDWHAENAQPKYWSCPNMRRGHLLYNLDTAKNYRTGVAMEGPLDQWSLGPMGMSTFGFPMTDYQQRIIIPYFRKHSLVMLFDPDILLRASTRRKYDMTFDKLSANIAGVAAVKLPQGYDPGAFDYRFTRRFIEREAKAQGVKVSWELR